METEPKVETITTSEDPCEGCDGANESDCCGAPIIWGCICQECGEHTEPRCNACEWL